MSDIPIERQPAPQATKILLVEDNFANRDMLTRRLQRRGYAVCSAEDGATGVAMAVSEMPDLILMDVALGEMDGWQATRLIKADARTSNIPIIALTAHGGLCQLRYQTCRFDTPSGQDRRLLKERNSRSSAVPTGWRSRS